MLTKTQINAEFKTLSDGLLKQGLQKVEATIAGWPVVATRLYNSRGCVGPAWNPTYLVGTSNDGKAGTRGPRDHVVAWLVRHQR